MKWFKSHCFKSKTLQLIVWVGFCFFTSRLYAFDNIHFSGFASVGAGKIDRNDDVTFMDYDGDWSFRSDTMLGLQADIQVSNRWSATLQALSRGFTFDDTSDFEPTLEWLFAKYQWTAETSIRLGRLRTPLYLYSDTLEIGYSYPWARPPVDTYAFVLTPLNTFDGADISTSFDFGSFYLDMSFFAGSSGGDYLTFDLEFDSVFGANFKFHFDDLLVRYGISVAKTDASSASLLPLRDAFEQFAVIDPIFADIAQEHETKDAWFHYHSLGLRWNIKSWTLITEQYYSNGPERGFANDAIGWYVSIAKQIGKVFPYFVAGYYKNAFSGEIAQLVKKSQEIVPPGVNPVLDGLRQIDLEATKDYDEKGESYTIGARYDFHRSTALKFELQYLDSNALISGDNLRTKPDETLVSTIILDVIF